MAKGSDGLRDAIFVDVEGVLVEIEDGAARSVEDGRVEPDLVGVLTQNVLSARALCDVALRRLRASLVS
jgi:hypothetical protein